MVMNYKNLLFVLVLLNLYHVIVTAVKATPFTEASPTVFGQDGAKNSKIVAFADLNFDKKTDIVTLSTADGVLRSLFIGEEGDTTVVSQLLKLNDSHSLSAVVPADFDGDLFTDFLFIYATGNEDLHRLKLCYGTASNHYDPCNEIGEMSEGEPMILDYNGDMLPDIILETPSGNLTLYLSEGSSRNFTSQFISSSLWGRLHHPHSSAFVDLNRDLAADIALTAVDGIFISINQAGKFKLGQSDAPLCLIGWPQMKDDDLLGMTTFLDYDSDSYIDAMTTVTTAKGLTTLYALSGYTISAWISSGCPGSKDIEKPTWSALSSNLTDRSGRLWQVSSADSWLRAGDVDNDGYTDLLVTLTNSGNTRPYILHNMATCSDCPRNMEVTWDWLSVTSNITQTLLFETYNDGMLDVIYNSQYNEFAELRLLDNNVAKQQCFVSVKVGSGLCEDEDDLSCSKPYPNMVGATVRYESTHADGSPATCASTQLSQSTNNALQMPYAIFGLGANPNFLDTLSVGVPRKKDYVDWSHVWRTIIPNSHLMVVPRPPDDPNQWVMHLYVTPSHLVLITGLVILALCALLSIIIALLHLKEKYEDRKLKLQESHKFHFSAM